VELKTILIGEDDPDDVVLLRRLFSQAEIANPLQFASNGEAVVSYLEGEGPFADRDAYPYPVILFLDVRLPRRNGVEVLEWIRSQPRHEALVTIGVSGSELPRELMPRGGIQFDIFLLKPLSVGCFRQTILGHPRVGSQISSRSIALDVR
jgi:CheY-like chemotaxis protein